MLIGRERSVKGQYGLCMVVSYLTGFGGQYKTQFAPNYTHTLQSSPAQDYSHIGSLFRNIALQQII
jgi:hypothetical protein